jgi:hypothetical protein
MDKEKLRFAILSVGFCQCMTNLQLKKMKMWIKSVKNLILACFDLTVFNPLVFFVLRL